MSTLIRPRNLLESSVVQIALCGAIACVFGGALVVHPKYVELLIVAILALIALAAAFVHPGRVFIALVFVLALIPSYAAPEFGAVLLLPAAALSWLLAAGLAWRNAITRGRPLSPNSVDATVLIFAVLMAVSLSFSKQVNLAAYENNLFLWGGPYLAARLLLQECERPVYLLAIAFAAVTVILAPIAILEAAGASNPFHHLEFNAAESSVWSEVTARFGHPRAVTSFGHPIAFAMFLATSALLSVGMAINSARKSSRFWWLAAAALATVGQALSYSRTGWIMLAIGLAILVCATARGRARRNLVLILATLVMAVVALLATEPPSELRLITGGGTVVESSSLAKSGQYREALLERALQPGVLHLWGNPHNMVTSAVSRVDQATDNAYIILADAWGLLPTFALFAVAAALLVMVVRCRLRKASVEVILPIVAFANLVALFFVAFITQQQSMVWLLLGASGAGADQLRRLRNRPGEERL